MPRSSIRRSPRSAVPALGLLAAVLATGCSTAPPVTLDDRVDRMITAEREIDTETARRYHQLANDALDARRWDDAAQYLKHALSADPTFGPARNNLGRVYFAQGRMYDAAWEFEYAARLMPHAVAPKNNLGLVMENVHRYDEAIEQYASAAALQRDNSEILGNLTRARIKSGDAGEDIRTLLQELLFKDTRPVWLKWAADRLSAFAGR